MHGGRAQPVPVEALEQVLEPAITERRARGILRLDHAVGIPDEQIAGLDRPSLDPRDGRHADAEQVAASDERVQLDPGVGRATQVRRRMTARHEVQLLAGGVEDRREARHRELAAPDPPHRGIERGDQLAQVELAAAPPHRRRHTRRPPPR